jgi:[acyl-carrier-protein] S-malonyltransferase
MHTPIVWRKFIPNRAALLMATMPGGLTAPKPPVLSLVTGKASYNDYNARDLLYRWTDHTQLLWDAVYEVLAQGIETVVHVGPSPNLIPATFTRLQENVETQMETSFGMRAVSGIVGRPWLKALLPARTALLRAPLLKHVILEDWLLENSPA